jgi:small ligand-binding sensory domain FIST
VSFAAALSTQASTAQAAKEVCDQAGSALAARADLAMVFFSGHHARDVATLARKIQSELEPHAMLGCIAEAVVGNDREVEDGPALSLWLAKWPRSVRVTPFHLLLERTADGPGLFGWPDELGGMVVDAGPESFRPARSAALLLGDPYSFPTDEFLRRINAEAPGVPVIGGMASGISGAGECKLLQDGDVRLEGAVGVLLEGPIGLRSIVSQGCRPIGRHMVITKGEKNIISELSGRTPLEQLRDLWESLSPQEQALFERGLHVGRVLNEYQDAFQRGDFLIRNVIGIERDSGALIISDHVRVGQTVQFQVRDADSADEDLHALLQLDMQAHQRQPAGALLFSCNGRGTRLFKQPDHDAKAIRQEAGPIPLAGLFAMGELGPVGKQNFIHGFTASVALFEE